MIRFLEPILNIIYPRVCVKCGNKIPYSYTAKWYCDTCTHYNFIPNDELRCEKCGKIIEYKGKCSFCNENVIYFNKGYVLYKYEDMLRNLIVKYKFSSKRVYASFFAENMYKYVLEHNIITEYDYVCSVPIHKRRLAQRGYNQAEIIAKRLAAMMEYPYKPLLVKIKNTKQQSTLNAKDRKANVKNAFACNYNLEGKKILIVDDIITTGNTINECCRMLKKAGAVSVDFIAVATPNINK